MPPVNSAKTTRKPKRKVAAARKPATKATRKAPGKAVVKELEQALGVETSKKPAETPEKNKGGRPKQYKPLPPATPRKPFSGTMAERPTEYEPKFAALAVEIMGEGYSRLAFCGIIGISRQRLQAWIDKNADLKDALEIAEAARIVSLENHNIRVMYQGGLPGTQSAIKHGLVSADPEGWGDKEKAPQGVAVIVLGKDVNV